MPTPAPSTISPSASWSRRSRRCGIATSCLLRRLPTRPPRSPPSSPPADHPSKFFRRRARNRIRLRAMKKLCLLAIALTICAASGLAQSGDELVNAGRNADNVTTHSMGYDRKSYSPLRQISRTNVKRLVPVWTTSVWNETGELAAPAVYNGVMYVINGRWTFALDVRTGRQIWRTPVVLEQGTQGAPIT